MADSAHDDNDGRGCPHTHTEVVDGAGRVCTACGLVVDDARLVSPVPFDNAGGTTSTVVHGATTARIARASAHHRERQRARAFGALRRTCAALAAGPGDLYDTAAPLFDAVLAADGDGMRFGLAAELVGAACAVLAARAAGVPAMGPKLAAARLGVDAHLLGGVLARTKRALATLDSDAYSPYLRPVPEDADVHALVLQIVAALATTDDPDLRLPPALAAQVRRRAHTLIRAFGSALAGRHTDSTALAMVLVAREAVDRTRAYPARYIAVLGLGAASTVVSRVRDLRSLLLDAAAPLPWRSTIHPWNLVHFMAQLLDLIDAGVLLRDAAVPHLAFRTAERRRAIMAAHVKHAVARLAEPPPRTDNEDGDESTPIGASLPRPTGRLLDELDLAIESLLLLHPGGLTPAQIADMSPHDVMILADHAAGVVVPADDVPLGPRDDVPEHEWRAPSTSTTPNLDALRQATGSKLPSPNEFLPVESVNARARLLPSIHGWPAAPAQSTASKYASE